MTFARVTDLGKGRTRPTLCDACGGCQVGDACEIGTLTGFVAREYDAAEMPSESEGTMVSESGPSVSGDDAGARPRRGRCPTCRQATSWAGNPQRPFCSLTCRLIDLGVWLDEGYAVPGEASDDVR